MEEDRRQNLQHYFLQISLSKPVVELASAKRLNQELTRDIDNLEQERTSYEAKYALADKLEARVAELSAKLREYEGVQTRLEQTTAQRDQFELDLVQRQSKINQQAINWGVRRFVEEAAGGARARG